MRLPAVRLTFQPGSRFREMTIPDTIWTWLQNQEQGDQTATKYNNPMCSCDPCTCAECACGVVTLGDLERRVLGIVWDLPDPEPTGREVADALPCSTRRPPSRPFWTASSTRDF